MSDEIQIEQRFATVPEWLLRADLSPDAKVIYAALQRLADTGEKMPGRTKLNDDWLHKSKSAVSRATAELEQHGALTVHRDTTPVGQSGRMITRNTYFLRTTNPQVTHVLPSRSRPNMAYSTGGLGHIWSPSKGLEELPTTTVPRTAAKSFKAVVVEISDDHQAVLGDLLELAAQLRQIRRDDLGLSDKAWSDVNVARAVVEAINAEHRYDVTLIPAALVALARDPETNVPQRLKVPGRWWDEATIIARRARKAGTAAARATAIANCSRCDDYGWLLPDANAKCSHEPIEEVG